MGLLARYRRSWFVIVLCLLAVPMLAQALKPSATTSATEARTLAPVPLMPRSLADWLRYPRQLDKYLADHFGFRDPLVRAHGLLRREADVVRFAALAARLHGKLRARNIEFMVTVAPNSTTIMRAQLPAWAAARPALTEYDLVFNAMAARAVPAVDLRPALLAANASHPVYRRADTHWNKLGALTAYNAVVAALRRPDWIVDPALVFRGFEPVTGGDLARMLGAGGDVSDVEARIDLSAYAPRVDTVSTFDAHSENSGDLIVTGRSGPAVLIIGDSFTQHYWPDYFSLHASRVIWIHHDYCTFAESVIDEQKPDIVILVPTERATFCGSG